MKNTSKNADAASKLDISNFHYQVIANTFPDLLIEIDRDGNILDYSTSNYSPLYVSPEQFTGRNIMDILPPSTANVAIENCRDALDNKKMTSFEYQFSMSSSSRIFEVRIRPFTKNSLLFVIRDITELKKFETEHQKLLDVLEVSLNEIYMFDPDTLSFQYANQGAIRNLGYSLEQLKTMTPVDIKPEFTEASFRKLIEPMLQREQEKYIFQTAHQRSDGSLYPVEVHLQLVKKTSGYVFLAVILDITERKVTEQKLSESEEKYRNLVEQLPAVVYVDLLDGKGTNLFVSSKIETILGVTEREWLNGDISVWSDRIHPEDRQRVVNAYFQLSEVGQSYNEEYRIITHDRRLLWIHDKGDVLQNNTGDLILHGVMFDVTAIKQGEEKLHKSERQMRNILENLELIAVILDTDGNITFCNDYLLQISGWTRQEILFKSWFEIFIPQESDDTIYLFNDAMEQGGIPTHFENPILTKSGDQKIVKWNNTILFGDDGKIIGTASIGEDITARKLAEQKLHESETRYRQMFETNQAVKLIIDPRDGRIVEANQAAVRFYGYDYTTLTQMKISEINTLSEEDVKREMENARGKERLHFNFRHRLVSGEIRDVEVYSGPIYTPQSDLLYSIIHDVTARKQNEAIIMARIRLLDFAASHSLDETLQAALDEAELLSDSVIGFFHFLNADQDTLSLHAWSTRTARDFCKADGKGIHYPVSDAGVWVDCIRERRPVVHNDYASLPHRKGLPEGHASVIRELVIPILRGNRIVAIMGMGNKPSDYTPQDMDILSRFADLVWDIAERMQAEEALDRNRQHLEEAQRIAHLGSWEWAAKTDSPNWSKELFDILEVDPNQQVPKMAEQDKLYTQESMIRMRSSVERTLQTGEPYEIELEHVRKDGSHKWLLARGERWFDNQGNLIGLRGTALDITERKKAEKRIQQQLMRLNGLHTIDIAISSSFELNTTLNIVLKQAITMLNIDACAILLYNVHSQILEYAAGRGFHSNALQHTTLRTGSGFAGRVVLERKTIHIPNLLETSGTLSKSLEMANEKFTDYYGVPLIVKGEVKGVLEIYHRSLLNPDTEWRAFLETLATQAAIAIDNTQLFESLQHSNLDLTLAYDATIEGWSRALDLRDKETEGHTQRVTNLTVKLAIQMGIPNADILHIRRGALLHDIGKMGIPDRILLKPDKLDAEEWSIMRKHTLYANDMLSPIAHLKPSLDIPLYHHENWDGSGYPYQLQGEQIPLPARIFTIVDVWDALTSDRPYRPAWSKDEAMQHIRDQSGKKFDPAVVDAFLDLMKNQ